MVSRILVAVQLIPRKVQIYNTFSSWQFLLADQSIWANTEQKPISRYIPDESLAPDKRTERWQKIVALLVSPLYGCHGAEIIKYFDFMSYLLLLPLASNYRRPRCCAVARDDFELYARNDATCSIEPFAGCFEFCAASPLLRSQRNRSIPHSSRIHSKEAK